MNDPQITLAYKFIDGNVGFGDNGIITLPLYMAAFLPDLKEAESIM